MSRVIALDSNRAGNDDAYVMAADRSRVRPLTREPSRESSPAVSPDGTRIAFASNRDGNNAIDLARIDGSLPRRLTHNRAHDEAPARSPDGQQLLFSSLEDGDGDLWIADVASGATHRLRKTNSRDRARELTAEFGLPLPSARTIVPSSSVSCFADPKFVSTLSTQLSWSHARDRYTEMCRPNASYTPPTLESERRDQPVTDKAVEILARARE